MPDFCRRCQCSGLFNAEAQTQRCGTGILPVFHGRDAHATSFFGGCSAAGRGIVSFRAVRGEFSGTAGAAGTAGTAMRPAAPCSAQARPPVSRSAGRDERRSSGRRFTPPPRARCPCHAARHCGYCGCCYASGIHQAPAYACPSRKLITSYLLPITSYWSSANNRLGDTFRSHASSRRRMRARSRGVVSSAPVRWSQPCAR